MSSSLSFTFGPGYIPWFTPTPLTTSVVSSYVVVNVYPLFYDKTIVEWSVPSQLGACTFNVYQSQTDVGPWEKLNPTPLSNTNFLEDISTQDFSKFHKTYYQVEVRLPSPDLRYIVSGPTSYENKRSTLMQIRATEITRREALLLNTFTGVDSYIFRRMYFGQRCPNCYDAILSKVTKDHCEVCYGTSFTQGYFPGIKTKVCYEATPNQTTLSYQGKLETNQTTGWTTSVPEVDTLDLVLRLPDFKLFRIEGMNQTELQTVRVRQLMQLTELAKSAIEYKLITRDGLINPAYTTPQLTPANASANIGSLRLNSSVPTTGNSATTTAGYVI